MATFPFTISGDSDISGKDFGYGPFEDGNNRYVVLQNNNPTPGLLTVYKSTDFGATWNEMDGGNAKPFSQAFLHYWVTQDPVGRKLYVVYWDASSNLILSTFNTATDTWVTANVTSTINCSGGDGSDIGFVVCQFVAGTGDVVAAFSNSSVFIGGLGNVSRTAFAICNLTSWSVATACGQTDPTNVYQWFPIGIVPGAANAVNVFYHITTIATPISNFPIGITQQAIHADSTVGAIQTVDSFVFLQEIPPSFSLSAVSGAGQIHIAYPQFINGNASSTAITYSIGTATDTIIFASTTITVSTGDPNFLVSGGISVAYLASANIAYVFWALNNQDTNVTTFQYQETVGGVTTTGTIGTSTANVGVLTSKVFKSNTFAYGISFSGTQYYWEQTGIAPPIPVTQGVIGGGGVYFPRYFNKSLLTAQIARIYGVDWILPRDSPIPPLSSFFLFPNQEDLCLSREFHLYNLVDRQAMSCARKPECFLQSERDWLDSPPGWIPFNPVGVVPLPSSASGDVFIFSFRVPYGYDGVITGQYHQYTLGFTEGSGDILWRVRADGRYLRDCGSIQVSLGSPKQLSPVSGGLQLRSGNIVRYIVSAPNVTGLLPPPGTGNILAGLHGFFYPRM